MDKELDILHCVCCEQNHTALETVRKNYFILNDELQKNMALVEKLRAKVAVLYRALDDVQWKGSVYGGPDLETLTCPECANTEEEGHNQTHCGMHVALVLGTNI